MTRDVWFIWAVKRKSAVSWFGAQFDKAVSDVEALRNAGQDIVVDISIYATCDDIIPSWQPSVDGGRVQSQERVGCQDEKSTSENFLDVSSRSSSSKEC
jgi:hypothetical protein